MNTPVFRQCVSAAVAALLVFASQFGLAIDLNPTHLFKSENKNNIPNPLIPAEPESPCNGKTIVPDSLGNFNFNLIPGSHGSGITGYSIQFSAGGVSWNDPINGTMKLTDEKGPMVPVNAGALLLVSKNWYWRVVTNVSVGAGVPGKKACKFAIGPTGGPQALTAPILVSPACSAQITAPTVVFDAKPGAGTFQIFGAELQRNSAAGLSPANWITSSLLTVVDKTNPGSKYGVAIPLQTLSDAGARWRWRARLYNEKMPFFSNVTQAAWSPWCEFTVPSKTLSKTQSAPVQQIMPTAPTTPAQGGSGKPSSSTASPQLPAVQQPTQQKKPPSR